jgi:hypothetical protein
MQPHVRSVLTSAAACEGWRWRETVSLGPGWLSHVRRAARQPRHPSRSPCLRSSRPRLHQLATLVEKICSQVRSQDRPLDCMGQPLGAPGAQRGTEVVRRDWPGEPLQRPRDCVVINWTTRMPARENDSGCWARSSFRIATARGESGTRCALRIFILFAGIFHTSPSISAHVAKRISLMRVPVKVRNSKARAATPARRAACA